MGRIGASEAVERVVGQRMFEGGEVCGRNHAVGVEKHKVVACGAFHAVVAGNGASFVFLVEVFYFEACCRRCFGLRAAWLGGAVFHQYHFEVACCLQLQAPEQFDYLVDTVVNRYDYGEFHQHMRDL